MKYAVVLDKIASYLVPSDSGVSFKVAIQEIVDYAREAEYTLQEEYFQMILDSNINSLDKISVTLA
jgi:hypothetical protein